MNMKASLFSAVLGIVTVSYAGAPTEDFKTFLKKFVPQTEKAIRSEDIGFFEKCSTPDFSYTDIKGTAFTLAIILHFVDCLLSCSIPVFLFSRTSRISL